MSVLAHKWVSSGALQGQAAFAKARVVVSLHGIMGQARNWMTAARQLVKRQPDHKVLLIDLRGHGANASPCRRRFLRAGGFPGSAPIPIPGLAGRRARPSIKQAL